MPQKPAAIILGLGKRGLGVLRVPGRLPGVFRGLPRVPRRFFSETVIIEEDDPAPNSTHPKYKPNFVIDFRNRRFTVYNNSYRPHHLLVGFIAVLFLYSLIQVSFKWKQNNRVKSIICMWILIIAGLCLLGIGAQSKGIVRKVVLMDSGKQIEVFELFRYRPTTIPILDIPQLSPEQEYLVDTLGLLAFEYNKKQFIMEGFESRGVTSPDPDMLKAIVKRTEVDVGTSGVHPTIEL